LLDAILQRFIEQQMSSKEIIKEGFDREVVEKVAKLFYHSEYKRRQAPPGVKITPMSFGRDRRYPLASGWKA
jgi:NH3-dependent NAD+ synthetase